MSGQGGDFSSELIVRKEDNLLVQWGKMVTSNVCSKWWVAPLLIIAIIYLYWKLDECQTKLKKHEGLSSKGLSGRQVAAGVTDFAGYRGTNQTLSHRDNAFSESPSFWGDASADKAAQNWNVTKAVRSLNNSGWDASESLMKRMDGDQGHGGVGSMDDSRDVAVVAEAAKESMQDAELALALTGNK